MNTSEILRFDESAWRAMCEVSANAAGKRNSTSHDLYVGSFSSDIDAQVLYFSQEHRAHALQIARAWDYASAQERAVSQQWNADNGFCCHGIELGYCPAGCGSGPDD